MENRNKTFFIYGFSLFTILFIIPVLLILFRVRLEDLVYVFTGKYYRSVVLFTLKQAFLSAFFSVLVGLPGAWIIKNCSFRLKKTVRNIYSISYVLPSILVVLGFVVCYGNNGLIAKLTGIKPSILYSFKAVLLAHVFYNFPVAVNVISSYWQNLDPDIENSARLLGASDIKVFFNVTLSRLIPCIVSAFSLIFLMCFTSFAIILVLGGGPEFSTTEVEIYRQARISMNIPRASALVLFSLTVSSLFLYIQAKAEEKCVNENPSYSSISFRKPGFFSVVYLFLTCLFILLPISGIIVKAFGKMNTYTLKMCFSSVVNTVFIGICSSFAGTLIAVLIAPYLASESHKKIFDFLSMLSLSVSSVIIGLSYFFISKTLHFVPKTVLIILCHSMICLPFSLKTVLSGFRTLPKSYLEAARNLGAGSFTILKDIEIGSLESETATSLVFCFAISCGELNASMLIGGTEVTTVPVQIYRMIASYNFDGACVLGLILIAVCLLANSVKLKVLDL